MAVKDLTYGVPPRVVVGRLSPGTGEGEFIDLSTLASFLIADGYLAPAGAGTSGITQLTGDVTAGPGGGSQAATIADAAVTYAKIQDVGASKLLGNPTGGSADVAEITLGTNLSFSGSTLNATAGISGIELTDGTHDVTGVTKITVTGGTVGGSTPNATLTITASSSLEVTDGTNDITAVTKETFTGSAAPTVSGTTPNSTITIYAMLPLTDGSTSPGQIVFDGQGQCIGVYV